METETESELVRAAAERAALASAAAEDALAKAEEEAVRKVFFLKGTVYAGSNAPGALRGFVSSVC
eukprot:252829-Prorocentrum_minimum.AAC.3